VIEKDKKRVGQEGKLTKKEKEKKNESRTSSTSTSTSTYF